MFSSVETALIVVTLTIVVFVLARSWRLGPREIFSPPCMFSLLVLYYVVLGPILFVIQDTVVFLGVDLRPILWKGWLASGLAYLSYLSGYSLSQRRLKIQSGATADKIVLVGGYALFGIAGLGMLYWILAFGGGLSFLSITYTSESAAVAEQMNASPLATYLAQLVNLSFAAACLLWLYVLDSKSKIALIIFILVVTISTLFYLKTGFRYRLAWLLIVLVAANHLWRNTRPKLWLYVPAGLLFIMLMGLIGITRNYFAGLSLDQARGMTGEDLVTQGMAEASIFYSVCQIVDAVPSRVAHTGFDPIWVAITYPIPRALWPAKPTSETLSALAETFGGSEAAAAGIAAPYYGEWFIAFGWFGIVGSSAIFGVLSRKMWSWYLERSHDKLATVIYAVVLGFIYVAFSRGLFAQAILNFTFALAPLFILYTFLPKSVYKNRI